MSKNPDRGEGDLSHSIESLTGHLCALVDQLKTEFEWNRSHHGQIMSVISEYAARVEAKFEIVSTSVDSLVASNTGIATDVAGLKEIILKLQTNPGPITPEDQALLDSLEAKVNSLVTKTTGN